MKHRIFSFARFSYPLAIAAMLATQGVQAQTIAWANTASATAWYTNTNWSPSTTAAAWTTANVAQFNNTGSATSAGINMGTQSLSIAAIEVTSSRTRALTVGNSSATAGTLTLNGATVNSVNNVILRNESSSLLTLQNNQTGSGKTMNVALGNTTNNIVLVEGSGGVTISSNISGIGRNLTRQGSGSGVLTLSGTNTYTGTTSVSAGTLFVTGSLGDSAVTVATAGTIGGSGTLGGSLTFDAGANLELTGATLVVDGASSGILTVAAGKTITLNDFNFTDIIGWDYASAAVGTYTLINGGLSVSFGGSTPTSALNAFDLGGGKKGYFQQGSLQAVIIPETSTALLGGLGLLVMLRRRR